MRPFPALAALLTVLAAATPAAAVGPIHGHVGTVYGHEGPPRESARLCFAMLGDGRTLGVDVDVEYTPGSKPTGHDFVSIAREAPKSLVARTDDGRALEVQATAAPGAVVTLPAAGDAPPRRLLVHFEQPPPPLSRFGWRHAVAEVMPPNGGFDVARDIVTTVVVPGGVTLPGFDCRRIDGHDECSRTVPRHVERVPVVLPAPLDPIGVALLLIATGASVYGFERMRRKRAAEHVERARVIAPIEHPPQDQHGGAYREAPARAVAPPTGDPSAALAALRNRASWIALIALGSTAAVAVLASGVSPWPMPSVTAAWIALVGFVSALVVERM